MVNPPEIALPFMLITMKKIRLLFACILLGMSSFGLLFPVYGQEEPESEAEPTYTDDYLYQSVQSIYPNLEIEIMQK
jgi:hypothetical protein